MSETTLIERPAKTKIKIMGHVIADYPSKKAARDLIKVMVEAGVSIIEIQIPFSEPMADGPLFMQANQKAIENGVSVSDAFKLMKEVSRKYPKVPFLFMTYANIIFNLGFNEFAGRAKASGARGVIAPDLTLGASTEFETSLKNAGLVNVLVVPPNISSKRLEEICQGASGLIYATARKGVTGLKTNFGEELRDFLAKIRQRTALPIAVGFGIKSRQDVAFLKGHADLAVIGSRGLEVYLEKGLSGAKKFWRSLAT